MPHPVTIQNFSGDIISYEFLTKAEVQALFGTNKLKEIDNPIDNRQLFELEDGRILHLFFMEHNGHIFNTIKDYYSLFDREHARQLGITYDEALNPLYFYQLKYDVAPSFFTEPFNKLRSIDNNSYDLVEFENKSGVYLLGRDGYDDNVTWYPCEETFDKMESVWKGSSKK